MKNMTGAASLTKTFFSIVVMCGATAALASEEPVVPPPKFIYCTVCHGADMMGNEIIKAPRLSGMEPWYLVSQLEAFSKGWRGTHDNDDAGIEMRPMAQALAPKEYAEAARFVNEVRSGLPVTTIQGDASRGATLFQTCIACHGPQAGGIEATHAPALTRQNDWYLVKQLQNFRDGIRGSNADDVYGQQMRTATALLPDDQAMLDVVAYISTLQNKQEN
jgi:cytochrome c553